jgi:hypothetical protein
MTVSGRRNDYPILTRDLIVGKEGQNIEISGADDGESTWRVTEDRRRINIRLSRRTGAELLTSFEMDLKGLSTTDVGELAAYTRAAVRYVESYLLRNHSFDSTSRGGSDLLVRGRSDAVRPRGLSPSGNLLPA